MGLAKKVWGCVNVEINDGKRSNVHSFGFEKQLDCNMADVPKAVAEAIQLPLDVIFEAKKTAEVEAKLAKAEARIKELEAKPAAYTQSIAVEPSTVAQLSQLGQDKKSKRNK